SVVCKAGILGLLQALASGGSYLDAHQSMDLYHNKRKTEEFQAQMRRELEWVRAAHLAVVAGTPVYLRLLSDTDGSVRTTVPYVLAKCPERMEEIEPALRSRIATETDPEVKASVLMALARLWREMVPGRASPLE